jgi:hypothetical protein
MKEEVREKIAKSSSSNTRTEFIDLLKKNKHFYIIISLLLAIIILLGISMANNSKSSATYFKNYCESSKNNGDLYDSKSQNEYVNIYSNNNSFGENCYTTTICTNRSRECDNDCEDLTRSCTNNSDCCSGCCRYDNNGGFKCVSEAQCSPCRTFGQTCSNNSQCCYGYNCTSGICQPPTTNTCVPNEQTCLNGNNSQCCSNCCKYHNGLYQCKPTADCCVHERETCMSNSDCCADLICRNNQCLKQCYNATETCASDSDCCSGLTCQNRVCARNCYQTSWTCQNDSQCCSGACRLMTNSSWGSCA